MNNVWTEKEKNFIRQNAQTMKDKDLLRELNTMTKRNVSMQALRKKRREMGIIKRCGRGICEVLITNTHTPNEVLTHQPIKFTEQIEQNDAVEKEIGNGEISENFLEEAPKCIN